MGGIPDEFVEQVRENCNFEELILARCQGVKRISHDRIVALCPFHQEKTGSFNVNLAMKRYYCFGCKAQGDPFRFVMEMEHVDFPGAVRFLAQRCGMPDPEESRISPEEAARARARRDLKGRLLEMHEVFAAWYMQLLREERDSEVHAYFLKRGLPWDVADRFRVGASPAAWDGALAFGRARGFTEEEMLEGGILIRNEERNSVYDRFRNRLMFPIWDEAGRVVGFSARTVEADSKGAKYVNSPETPIFHKGELLYALPLARDGFKHYKNAILCEGQLDAIALHRAGFDCAVAPQGTGFTAEQAKLLTRYVSKVTLCFDADTAGRKATLAALEHLLPLNFEVRAIAIAGGKDPDEILRHEGAAGVGKLVENSIDLPEIIFNHLKNEVDLASPFGKDEAVKTLEHYFGMLASPVVRSQYWELAATRLSLPPEILYAELRRLKLQAAANSHHHQSRTSHPVAPPGPPGSSDAGAAPEQAPGMPEGAVKACELLFQIALVDEAAARQVADEVSHELLERSPIGQALNRVSALALNGEWEELMRSGGKLLAEIGDSEGRVARSLAAGCPVSEEARPQAIRECIATLRRISRRSRRDELKQALRAAAGTEEEARLFAEWMKLG